MVNTVKTGRTGIPVRFPLKELGSLHSILSKKKAEQTEKPTTSLGSVRGSTQGKPLPPRLGRRRRNAGVAASQSRDAQEETTAAIRAGVGKPEL